MTVHPVTSLRRIVRLTTEILRESAAIREREFPHEYAETTASPEASRSWASGQFVFNVCQSESHEVLVGGSILREELPYPVPAPPLVGAQHLLNRERLGARESIN